MQLPSTHKSILPFLLGKAEQVPVNARIFHAALLLAIVLCLSTALVNIAVQLPAFAIFAALVSAGLFTGAYLGSRIGKIHTPMIWLASIWLPLFVASVWIFNSGSTGATHCFLIILPAFFLPFANTRQKVILTALYCGISASLLTLEYWYPGLIRRYATRSEHYSDMLFATLATQVAFVALISFLLREHTHLTNKLEKLREKSESRFGEVADTIPAIIVELNADLIVDFVNRACLELTGFASAELDSTVRLGRIIHPDDWPVLKPKIQAILSGKGELSEECRLVTKDGSTKTVLMRAVARHRNSQPDGVLLYMVDITEKKLLEHQYLKAQKMESIGMLAGGIAHDFNNLLTAIVGYANLIRMYNATPSGSIADAALESNVEPIITASNRAADLVRRLLIFSRQQPLQKTRFDVRELVEEASDLLAHAIDKKIAIQVDSLPDPLMVQGDRSLLVSSLMNLGVNARDAMPHGGKLTITCRRVDAPDAGARGAPSELPRAGFAQIVIADTGTGMSPEVKQHLFEPFFTTKAVGKGTGLGLASVHGAVADHGGHITLTSEIGKGTTFRIYLPLSVDEGSAVVAVGNEAPIPRGDQRVLVVDDEVLVGSLVKEILIDAGYKATLFSDPVPALQAMKDAVVPFDLAVVDMIMPHMNGLELVKALHEVYPKMRALMMSGYAGSGDTQSMTLDPRIEMLGKPFDPETLTRALARLAGRQDQA